MESLQRQIVEIQDDDFGMQAMKLEKMLKKHSKADFMDKIKVRPDYDAFKRSGANFTTLKDQ